MTRCELTDLDTAMCAHCRPVATTDTSRPRPPAGPAAADPVGERPWFTAIYPGECAACGEPFTPGMQIRLEQPSGWRADCCRGN